MASSTKSQAWVAVNPATILLHLRYPQARSQSLTHANFSFVICLNRGVVLANRYGNNSRHCVFLYKSVIQKYLDHSEKRSCGNLPPSRRPPMMNRSWQRPGAFGKVGPSRSSLKSISPISLPPPLVERLVRAVGRLGRKHPYGRKGL
jgi:hypothetical protein